LHDGPSSSDPSTAVSVEGSQSSNPSPMTTPDEPPSSSLPPTASAEGPLPTTSTEEQLPSGQLHTTSPEVSPLSDWSPAIPSGEEVAQPHLGPLMPPAISGSPSGSEPSLPDSLDLIAGGMVLSSGGLAHAAGPHMLPLGASQLPPGAIQSGYVPSPPPGDVSTSMPPPAMTFGGDGHQPVTAAGMAGMDAPTVDAGQIVTGAQEEAGEQMDTNAQMVSSLVSATEEELHQMSQGQILPPPSAPPPPTME
jgi:hypothetical protein